MSPIARTPAPHRSHIQVSRRAGVGAPSGAARPAGPFAAGRRV